jgi:hypothetical protein
VPRPADDTGSAPGGTGTGPILGLDEEPLAEPRDESTRVDSPTTAAVTFGTGEDSAAAAAEPFDAGLAAVPGGYGEVTSGYGEVISGLSSAEADYRSGSRVDDTSGELDADVWKSDTDVWSTAVAGPPAERFLTQNRLPIFEAVESDWFRQGGQATVRFGGSGGEASHGWSSPADEGWRAAEVVHAPSSGGVTSAGLPKRVPRANLVPGAAAAAEGGTSATAPTRSAAATRDRFSSFQRGARRGRAAADGEEDGEGGA